MPLAKVMALFVFAGGVVGGAVTGVLLTLWSIAYSLIHGYFDAGSVFAVVPSFIMISALGILFGLPASIATGSIYAASSRVRHYRHAALVGGTTSALWGGLFAVMLTPGRLDASALWFVAFFALSGIVAAIACHRIAKRWPEVAATESAA
jgi:hypothetical protein